ncbi:prenyltransferase alpha subunit, putative [Plasmodium vivax]|uniref:Protein farnesyltransferase/geranylgeranyltransferase type-1 subunit alpha n=1 Tax=Plasmodium vivax (strain Salvador I) TaxID=126793 RepID=A5K8S9_PLAVS|nr:prenyltransferase alpha subunit, putative [Plasmodium vivax]EDL44225.1 prenyltransferase alpha subunit, putative [Plasmodium vivax]|eukprot:XP_001613952.1 prenyltransferase alpha subunit [Plasmodium vivax Sal-1]
MDMTHLERERQKLSVDMQNERNVNNKEKVHILSTYYTDNEQLVYSSLASFIESKKYSFEGYVMSTFAIKVNPSYYSAWMYRRKCLRKLNLNLLNELRFTKCVICDNIKSFQSWFHRRWLVEYICKLARGGTLRGEQAESANRGKRVGSRSLGAAHSSGENSSGGPQIAWDSYDLEDEGNFISSDGSGGSDGSGSSSISGSRGSRARRASPGLPAEERPLEEDAFLSNCEEADFDAEKADVAILHEDLQNLVESCEFFKNALRPNGEPVNIDEFLYEEMLYSNCDIFLDAKNYNSWAHKTWLIDKLGIFKNKYLCEQYNIISHEFNFINYFLKHDIYNNSVWVYRYFILTKLKYTRKLRKMEREIKFCLNYAKQFPHNEAIFKYLFRVIFLYTHLYKKKKKNVADIFEIPLLLNLKEELAKLTDQSKYVLIFLSELYSFNGQRAQEVQCYRHLQKNDNFNDAVWRYRIEEAQMKQPCDAKSM